MLGLFAVAIGALVWRGIQPGDIQRHLARLRAEGVPTTSAELDAWYPAVPDAENAGKLLLEAASGFRTPRIPALVLDFSQRPSMTNPPTAERLAANRAYLATNASTLAAIHTALQHPNSRFPINLNAGVLTLLPHLAVFKGHAQQLGVCAEMAAECDQPQLAAQCLLDGLHMARILQQEPLLISFLVKIACEAIATTSTERVFHRITLSRDQLVELQAAFGEAAAAQSYERAMVGELCMNLDAFRLPVQKKLQWLAISGAAPSSPNLESVALWLHSVSGMKNRDLKVMVDYYDQSRLISRLPPTKRRIESEHLNHELNQQLQSHFLPFTRMLLPDLQRIDSKAARNYSVLRCAEVACAVERWRLEHQGALPSSLDALVPGFLAAVPEDPMDGRPFKFRARPNGFVVYSIGEDGTDDGGTVRRPATTNHWDYTFVVER